MHKGSRIADADYFDDRLEDRDGGVLSSEGLNDYDSVKSKLTSAGYEVLRNCTHCGTKRKITIEFDELFKVGMNRQGRPVMLPADWEFSPNNGTAFVSLPCNSCGEHGLAVHVTPDEAKKVYTSAADSGLIKPREVQQHQQQMAAMRGGR